MVREKKALGKWFPKATVIKGVSFDESVKEISILLFYQYVQPRWTGSRKIAAIAQLERLGLELSLGGRLRVAEEGINATVTGTHEDVVAFTQALKAFDSSFEKTDFKFIPNMPLDRAFGDLKVLPVKELVYYGIDNEHTLGKGGEHLEPEAYHEKLSAAGNTTVVIDVRNTYESEIGRFDAQHCVGGAKLIDPGMRKSTDFPAWLALPETREKLKDKEVLMYCTGGVRCERASALLQREYGDDVKGVFQLQGGIEKYLQKFPDGGFWRGKNYVFDKREAFSVDQLEGVGGVLKPPPVKNKKGKKNQAEKKPASDEDTKERESKVLGRCAACNEPWDRYIGKRKCTTCEVPVLVCEKCCTGGVGKNDKSTTRYGTLLRCSLCVKDGCTVRAKDLLLTDNGRGVRSSGTDKSEGDTSKGTGGGEGVVAAKTVCFWGGGNGRGKRERDERRLREHKEKLAKGVQGQASAQDERHSGASKRRRETIDRDLGTIPCKFGARCKRSQCWFAHPERLSGEI